MLAYINGIFPWYEEDLPILWHSPDPRCVIFPEELKIRKSLKQSIRNKGYQIKFDQSFEQVIQACSEIPRHGQDGTWITEEMIDAYCELNRLGFAHSVEAYLEGELVGGLYGIDLGNIFCGESMFSLATDASKICLVALVSSFNWKLVDCQVYNEHLGSLGARNIAASDFQKIVKEYGNVGSSLEKWNTCSPNFQIIS